MCEGVHTQTAGCRIVDVTRVVWIDDMKAQKMEWKGRHLCFDSLEVALRSEKILHEPRDSGRKEGVWEEVRTARERTAVDAEDQEPDEL